MLYIHIPFCKSRCIYCDFYSTTCGDDVRAGYVDALIREMALRVNEWPAGEAMPTVYLGGGTPSQLSESEVERIFAAIHDNFCVASDAEITFEANPDDVTPGFINVLKRVGVNRVSLGVQTFNDERLRLLRRRHTSSEARKAVEMLFDAGITNLSIDLIYGLPQQSLAQWRSELAVALSLPVTHLSAYSLMVEPGTALFKLVESGRLMPADEDVTRAEYDYLLDFAAAAGFEHYEISNFARPGFRSRHNSAYWRGVPYLGLGAGAHSFDGEVRRHVPDDVMNYIKMNGEVAPLVEVLTADERYNELVFTALRTRGGLRLADVAERFGSERVGELLRAAGPHLRGGWLERVANGAEDDALRLTREGIFVSDDVMSDLMIV